MRGGLLGFLMSDDKLLYAFSAIFLVMFDINELIMTLTLESQLAWEFNLNSLFAGELGLLIFLLVY